MRLFAWIFVLIVALADIVSGAVTPNKLTFDFNNIPIRGAASQISRQAHVWIVVDPKVQCSITANLNSADLGQVMDAITKPGNFSWKKLTFALQQNSSASPEELKSGILALASMPLVGLAIQDPATKTCGVFANGLPTMPNLSQIKLPDGYKWATIYVILSPPAALPVRKDEVRSLSEAQQDVLTRLTNASPDERVQILQSEWISRLNLPPNTRRALFRDEITALLGLDPQYRNQLTNDYRIALRGITDPFRSAPPRRNKKPVIQRKAN